LRADAIVQRQAEALLLADVADGTSHSMRLARRKDIHHEDTERTEQESFGYRRWYD
jgi:hypothetical protein